MTARVTFIGNCQAQAVGELYREHVAAERGETVVILADVDLVRRAADAGTEGLLAGIAASDTVVEQVLEWRPPIADAVARARRHVRFPLVSGWFLWPFSGDPHPRNAEVQWPGFEGPYPAEYGDRYLNRKLGEGVGAERAIAEYLALDVARAVNLDRRSEILLDQQRQRDGQTDLAFAGLIERRLPAEPLFTSRGHPTMRLFAPLVAGVFEQLGVATGDIARIVAALDAPPFPPDQAPVHPAVAAHFGLSYITPATRFAFDEGHFTFAEFATRYTTFQWNETLRRVLAMHATLPDADALAMLNAGLTEATHSLAGQRLRARLLHRLGRLDDAIAAAEAASRLAPDDPRALLLLSELHRVAGQPALAVRAARDALALHPFHPPAHAALAEALLALDDPRAVAAAARARALAPCFAPYQHLHERARRHGGEPPDPAGARRREWRFSASVADATAAGLDLRDGWSGPEAELIWMVGQTSALVLPATAPASDLLVELECWPHINDRGLDAQRLTVAANGKDIAAFVVSQLARLHVRVPSSAIVANAPIELSFRHPDAAAPASFPGLGNDDQRALAIALVCLTVTEWRVASPGERP